MTRAGYTDIRTAGPDAGRCSSCSEDLEEGTEYAYDMGGMLICERCLEILEDEDAKGSGRP